MNFVKKLPQLRSPKPQRRTNSDACDTEQSTANSPDSSGAHRSNTIDCDTPTTAANQQDRTLAMMHMRKLFTDLIRSQLSSAEYEQRLFKMLPLFHKVCLFAFIIFSQIFKPYSKCSDHNNVLNRGSSLSVQRDSELLEPYV